MCRSDIPVEVDLAPGLPRVRRDLLRCRLDEMREVILVKLAPGLGYGA